MATGDPNKTESAAPSPPINEPASLWCLPNSANVEGRTTVSDLFLKTLRIQLHDPLDCTESRTRPLHEALCLSRIRVSIFNALFGYYLTPCVSNY